MLHAPNVTDPRHRLVVAGLLAAALSSPGQSFGIAFYVEPILAELPVSRTVLSALYGLATLLAAAALPVIGSFADRWPSRRMIPGAVALLGLSLAGLSLVSGPVGLVVALIGLRLFGQGAIGLSTITGVSRLYPYHRAKALAVASLGYPVGEMIFPVLLAASIAALGWRSSLQVLAVVYVTVVFLGLRGLIRPEPPAAVPGTAGAPSGDTTTRWTMRIVLRNSTFLTALGASAIPPLAITGVLFHQIALFERLGWGAGAVPGALAVFAVGGVFGTVVAGALLDRWSPRWGFRLAALAALAAIGSALLPNLSWPVFSGAIGFASGLASGANGLIWSHYFGVEILGRLKGTVTAVRNGATALGPPLLAIGLSLGGTARTALFFLIVMFALMAVLAWALPRDSDTEPR